MTSVCLSAEPGRARQGSFTGLLDSGIRLSFSFCGPSGALRGVTTGAKPISLLTHLKVSRFINMLSDVLVTSQETEEASTESSSSVPVQCSSSPQRMEQDSGPSAPEDHTRPPRSPVRPPSEDRPTYRSHPFSSLSLSVPHGLLLQILREEAGGQ